MQWQQKNVVDWMLQLKMDWRKITRLLCPTPGNILFTLLVIAGLLWAQSVGAISFAAPAASTVSTSAIPYQGRLADANGAPLTGAYTMVFRLYSTASGGTALWEEQWTGPSSVQLSDGLFNVLLGSLTAIPQGAIGGNNNLFLGITVGADAEMTPRVQLGSVPFAVQALTVPDGSVTSAKLNVDNGMVMGGKLTVTGNGVNNDFAIQIGNQGAYSVIPSQTDAWGISYDGGNFSIFDRQGGKNFRIGQYYGSTLNFPFFIQGTNGYVGIGTTSPNANLHVIGNFQATGTKSAVVNTEHYGQRKLYAYEQATNRFGDEGKAQLVDGSVTVQLDPIFLETIEGDFLVHVTPYGDASLYVADIGADYFVVKAREGDPNVTFAWQLSAPRKGFADVRLEEVEK